MTSSKHGCILMSLSNIKMSARACSSGREKEEELVRRVGGRGRDLVQVVLRIRRERAGRTPPNWQDTQNNILRPGQEVGPCGQEEERRLGGFQVRGMRIETIDDGPWTDDMYDGETPDRHRERCRIRWARARPGTPSHTQTSL